MTRGEALLELAGLVTSLPPGSPEERVAKAAERLAAHEAADLLRALLVELAIAHLAEKGAP